jgi:hypothetical protein
MFVDVNAVHAFNRRAPAAHKTKSEKQKAKSPGVPGLFVSGPVGQPVGSSYLR